MADSRKKIVSLQKLKHSLSAARRRGKRIAFTNGCFDILHLGHVQYLEKAKAAGDILVVGLNSDASVRRIKGPKRPIVPQQERAGILAGLSSIDYVVIFNEDTPAALIKAIVPDVLTKGADWKNKEVVGSDVVRKNGGKVKLIKFLKGRSTTNIIEKVLKNG